MPSTYSFWISLGDVEVAQVVDSLERVVGLRAHAHHVAARYRIGKALQTALQVVHSLVDLGHVLTVLGLLLRGRRILLRASAQSRHHQDACEHGDQHLGESRMFHVLPALLHRIIVELS